PGIPIGLTGMTVSPSESVKSEFRSNHTSQYTRPSNSLEIQGNDSVPELKIVVLEHEQSKDSGASSGWLFQGFPVLPSNILLFPGYSGFKIPMDSLFAYWLHIIQKTLVFSKLLVHISHQECYSIMSVYQTPANLVNIQISVPTFIREGPWLVT
ncbi:hypothetical protein HAX54_020041, partial [Datura stramonium]|nr:hypothetical protein [Datura stramonium]